KTQSSRSTAPARSTEHSRGQSSSRRISEMVVQVDEMLEADEPVRRQCVLYPATSYEGGVIYFVNHADIDVDVFFVKVY
ncbi:hypothetical protein LC574_29925, partial [Nostoc sp. CHAB 5715]|nr:hypothetical protein [Nostoc sp. CHAB 5715]